MSCSAPDFPYPPSLPSHCGGGQEQRVCARACPSARATMSTCVRLPSRRARRVFGSLLAAVTTDSTSVPRKTALADDVVSESRRCAANSLCGADRLSKGLKFPCHDTCACRRRKTNRTGMPRRASAGCVAAPPYSLDRPKGAKLSASIRIWLAGFYAGPPIRCALRPSRPTQPVVPHGRWHTHPAPVGPRLLAPPLGRAGGREL